MDRSGAPPGWDENPTAWRPRLVMIALASVGLIDALYLTLFQIDFYPTVWDPFFEPGAEKILGLTEPVPDAFFGVMAYGTEILLSLIGGTQRWRTQPWAVLAFGLVIVTGGVVSVILVAVQPTIGNTWCTLCLLSAAVSLVLVVLGIKEPVAGLQHLARVRADGGSLWRALWGLEPERSVA